MSHLSRHILTLLRRWTRFTRLELIAGLLFWTVFFLAQPKF